MATKMKKLCSIQWVAEDTTLLYSYEQCKEVASKAISDKKDKIYFLLNGEIVADNCNPSVFFSVEVKTEDSVTEVIKRVCRIMENYDCDIC